MADELEKLIKIIADTKGFDDIQKGADKATQSINKMAEMVARAAETSVRQQESQQAALQRYLGQMDARGQKEADAEAKIYSARAKNIQLMEQMSVAQMAAGRSATGAVGGTNQMAVAMQNMNYVVRDSPYFFMNFRMGVMAIGNNLNPLYDSLVRANAAAKEMGTTLGVQMVGFLKGPGGVIFAMSVLVTVIQAVVFAMSGHKDAVKKVTDAFEDFLEKYKSVETQMKKNILRVESMSLDELRDSYKGAVTELQKLIDKKVEYLTIGNKPIVPQYIKELTQNNTPSSGLFGYRPVNASLTNKPLTETSPEMKQYQDIIDIQQKMAQGIRTIQTMSKEQYPILYLDYTQKQLTDVTDKLKEFAKTAPVYFKSALKIGSSEFQLTGIEAKNLAKQMDDFLNPKDEKTNATRDFIAGLKEQIALAEAQNKPTIDLLESELKILNAKSKQNLNAQETLRIAQEQASVAGKIRDFYLEISKIPSMPLSYFSGGWQDAGGQGSNYRDKANDNQRDRQKIWTDLERDTDRVKKELIKSSFEDQRQQARETEAYMIGLYKQSDITKSGSEKQFAEYKVLQAQLSQQKIDEINRKQYIEQLDAVGNLGNAMASAFGQASDSFIAKLNQALQIAVNIAKAINNANNPQTDSVTGFLGEVASFLPLLSLFHGGGIVKAHDGRLNKDEVPIIGKKGEMIMNEQQQNNLWNMIKSGKGGGDGSSNAPIYINVSIPLDGKEIAKTQIKFLPSQLKQLMREDKL